MAAGRLPSGVESAYAAAAPSKKDLEDENLCPHTYLLERRMGLLLDDAVDVLMDKSFVRGDLYVIHSLDLLSR